MMKVALVGNPNSGKTTLFNHLTGLRQRTGNYHGITVEASAGLFSFEDKKYEIIDLPGLYNLYPSSEDEKLAVEALLNPANFEVILFVIDFSRLRNSLILLQQIASLGVPMAVVVNKIDNYNSTILQNLQNFLLIESGLEVWLNNENKPAKSITHLLANTAISTGFKYNVPEAFLNEWLQQNAGAVENPYRIFIQAANTAKEKYAALIKEELLHRKQKADALYVQIHKIITNSLIREKTRRIDRFALHPVYGILLLLAALFVIFQGLFFIANLPMTWIENLMGWISERAEAVLPQNFFGGFITGGIIPGISGILVFVPQIFILFTLLGILEESGYMARIQHLCERVLSIFGLDGKSVIPMISGTACAIPAIMATRTISNRRSRLLTMLIIPLIPCSARLPVFVLLISLLPVSATIGGFISVKGIFLLGIYLLGAIFALVVALVLSGLLVKKADRIGISQLPDYRRPSLSSVFTNAAVKSWSFISQAGPVIFIVTVLICLLSYVQVSGQGIAISGQNDLNTSVIGWFGKKLEPLIGPLGYDWKIGIAIICSFAAREVFVSTLLTIYYMGEDAGHLLDTLQMQTNTDGTPVYGVATVLSLFVFYFFALQCVSTLAVLKKESGGWKWPLVLLLLYGAMAYLGSLLVYQLLR